MMSFNQGAQFSSLLQAPGLTSFFAGLHGRTAASHPRSAVHLWAGRYENWRHAAVSMLKPPEGEPAGELDFGLKLYKVGSYQFRERRTEAEENIKKPVGLMLDQELATTLDSRLLQESSLPGARYGQKLCPGFWPIC